MKTIISILAAMAIAMPAIARESIENLFINAPQDIFMLLDKNARLDMIDYFKANQATPVDNNLSGKSRITAISPSNMTIEMTPSSTYQLALLPAAKEENDVVALIVTVTTPARDSRISFYKASDWSHIDSKKVFTEPLLSDWLSDKGKADRALVEAMVPFIMAYYIYNPEGQSLVITHDLNTFLSPEIFKMVNPYLRPTLTYFWNGKKFSPAK